MIKINPIRVSQFSSTLSVFSVLLLYLILSTVSSPQAQAIVQVRAHYGLQTVNPDQVSSFPAFSKLSGYGGDLIISPPLFPLAFGVRYEQMSAEESNSYGKITMDLNRTSALLAYRLIDTLIFAGAIGTYGLNHGGEQKLDVTGVGITKVKNDVSGSYSIGVEGGVKLIGFILGAEVGYLGLNITSSSAKQKLDGVYTKLHLGYDF